MYRVGTCGKQAAGNNVTLNLEDSLGIPCNCFQQRLDVIGNNLPILVSRVEIMVDANQVRPWSTRTISTKPG